jgi:predicted O-methyltransferase YrrM
VEEEKDAARQSAASAGRIAMVERVGEQNPGWSAVDTYIADRLLGDDPALSAALAANAAGGLPDIDVSPAQGRMLHLFARMARARRILEIGKLISLEIEPHHADVARSNVAKAGLSDRVDIRTGPALDSLQAMIAANEGPFDFVFIDADKQNNPAYVRAALAMSRPGTTIVVDNVIREGGVLDAASGDERIRGTRRLFDEVGREPRLTATAVQTVGVKKWDGFLIAIVD